MFYSQFILAKKGPLGTIWIAAHLERKLRKNQVADTDIGVSVDSILFPDVPIALRLSSHLLLGVVRIYSRKVNYLFDDCSEALLKIKQAFRSTAVDLPPEESTAPYHSITLPETFDLDDFELPDNDIFQGNYVDHHVSTREQITLQDTMDGMAYSTSQFGLDERFGDGDASQMGLDLDEDLLLDKGTAAGHGVSDADPQGSVKPTTHWERDNISERMSEISEERTVNDGANQLERVGLDAEPIEYAEAPSTPGLVQEPNLSSGQKALASYDHFESEDQNSNELMATESRVNDLSNSDCHNGDGHTADWPLHKDSNHDTVQCMLPEENGYHVRDAAVKQAESLGSGSLVVVDADIHACLDAKDPKTSNNDVAHEETASVSINVLKPCSYHVSEPHMSSPGHDNSVAQNLQPLGVELHSSERSKMNQASVDVEGEECYLTDVMQSEKSQISGPSVCGDIQEDNRTLDEPLDNATASNNELKKLNNSITSDLPAPEKLLSVPEGLLDKPNDLIVESTPEKEVLAGSGGVDAGNKLNSGKKRSYTESTITVESLNSSESFGVDRTKRNSEFIPDDDDLLSSILVGRKSSVLKMKPTPPVREVASRKRARSASQTNALKRKVLMDDTMVLHGDVIRQQLTNTEDIRRIRKKAPCTGPEILMIQMQFLEDDIFNEPIFTGMSAELTSVHCETHDLSKISISETDKDHGSSEIANDIGCSIAPNVIEGGKQGSKEPVALRNNGDTQPAETSIQTESHQGIDHQFGAQNTDAQGHINSDTDVVKTVQNEPLAELNEMDVDRGNVEVAEEATCSVNHGFGTSSQTDVASAEVCNQPTGDKTNAADASLLVDTVCLTPELKVDAQPVEVGTSVAKMDNAKGVEDTEVIDRNIEDIVAVETEAKGTDGVLVEEGKVGVSVENGADVETDRSVLTDAVNTQEGVSLETGGYNELAAANGDNSRLEVMNEDGPLAGDWGPNGKDPTSNHMFSEEPVIDSTNPVELGGDTINVSLDDGKSQVDLRSPMDDGRMEIEEVTIGNDTEFLNVNDDEVAEDYDDGDGCPEDARVLENSGWSSRTRAVSKYLQTLFVREPVQGRKVLALDHLLVGKTRKEASRMFFETLVLKTKDYIHVEQARPLDNINIKPGAKLMKADF
ncbi:sister chromatid cohesion 1 protein 4 isoform X2 [Citrus clementina]|uniref:sister chromatid cohesion 1 protein 4 isoform X2 n=1 Tax=Citrus clementina TaxID=85681 RepID=UPI000CED314A|nr:sister chromatid cohesion 1 protein 4 isoform X2 [Citrus x clementina]